MPSCVFQTPRVRDLTNSPFEKGSPASPSTGITKGARERTGLLVSSAISGIGAGSSAGATLKFTSGAASSIGTPVCGMFTGESKTNS
jgi:hypothetical protein